MAAIGFRMNRPQAETYAAGIIDRINDGTLTLQEARQAQAEVREQEAWPGTGPLNWHAIVYDSLNQAINTYLRGKADAMKSDGTLASLLAAIAKAAGTATLTLTKNRKAWAESGTKEQMEKLRDAARKYSEVFTELSRVKEEPPLRDYADLYQNAQRKVAELVHQGKAMYRMSGATVKLGPVSTGSGRARPQIHRPSLLGIPEPELLDFFKTMPRKRFL